ncbi:hypothetical protein [Microbulbifer thermotolerans]|uniref:Uncharacterized protein n=1 Tax=Microbulbifer thermotolerans TaxID=252514 RepID=A0A143HIC7_MICTH|nr:hypothetical protein [Microbulbifer thermotolerans]AMX01230.1 hypothetical protein A3224_00330 [Microbulbifer thermotolerans]MCX2778447.1 hypothetical protein [Microbulbifer thermotolerans]MCX2783917.1 hypothetical protein [Microbulbifer thermotolerans]MCX2793930.1 hypothetical protein [Microbulbifer thermotolerans]MCX2802523.1 hypothetical protein [Microbulbifer thermotolerans]
MNHRYLCANHHQWLTADPLRAEQAWMDWIERGASLCEDGNQGEAIPFLGCAYELADFLLSVRRPAYAIAAQRFAESARLLMDAYHHRGQQNHGNYILVGASSRLARELKDGDNYRITADCIRTLYTREPNPPARQQWQRQLGGIVSLH